LLTGAAGTSAALNSAIQSSIVRVGEDRLQPRHQDCPVLDAVGVGGEARVVGKVGIARAPAQSFFQKFSCRVATTT
jgi:hypothetical protein